MIFPERGKRTLEITKELRRLLKQEPPNSPQRRIMRASIMGYELGSVQQFVVKDSQHGLPQSIKDGLEHNAKLGMADLVTQCRMLCFDLGWEFDSIQELGVKHLQERHKDFEKDGYGES